MSTKGTWNPVDECPLFARLSGQFQTGTVEVIEGEYVVDWRFTSNSTAAGTSVVPFYVKTTMTGAGGVGGRAQFDLSANVALGGWANALKAYTAFGASGSVTGLGSAFCGELALSAGTTSGSYAALEAELVLGTGAKTGTATSFLYCGASGAAAGEFDDNGFLFELAGLTESDGHIFDATDSDDIDMTHALRVRINGTTYYLALSTSKDFTD